MSGDLRAKQEAMRLRQRVRPGPVKQEHRDPIHEMQLRVRLAYRWSKWDISERELSREFDRPIAWVRAWLECGCPLF